MFKSTIAFSISFLAVILFVCCINDSNASDCEYVVNVSCNNHDGTCIITGSFCIDCDDTVIFRIRRPGYAWINVSVNPAAVCEDNCLRYEGSKIVTCGITYAWEVWCGDPVTNVNAVRLWNSSVTCS